MRLAAVARHVAPFVSSRRVPVHSQRVRVRDSCIHVSSTKDSLPSPSTSTNGGMGEIIDEQVAYDRYLTVFDRTVEFPPGANGHTGDTPLKVKYDIVGHPRVNYRFAVIFPFHPACVETGTPPSVTIIREYCQASNEMGYSLPTGGFNPKKHKNLAQSAKDELAEEAMLKGTVVDMLDDIDGEHPGFVEGKWCSNRFRPYLALDLQSIANPPARDVEEFSIEISKVTVPEFKKIMYSGKMMVPSIVTANMALDRLVREGFALE